MLLINEILSLITRSALSYKKLLGYDFILESKSFKYKKKYIVIFKKENFLHLCGVDTNMHPIMFFEKALRGDLIESDLIHNSKRYLRYIVKKKIRNLLNIESFFNMKVDLEEDFHKGIIYCLIAATNNKYTLGFIGNNKCRPRTLLDDNQLNPSKIIKNVNVKKRLHEVRN